MQLKSPGIWRFCLALPFAAAVAVAGCAGDTEADDEPGEPDADPSSLTCHPVLGPGCPGGEKCCFILTDPLTGEGRTGCSDQGSVAIGAECTSPQLPGEADDCVSGSHCYNGRCRAMCVLGFETCAGGSFCVEFEGLDFDLCLPGCDPLLQNCEDMGGGTPQGCYLIEGGSVCAAVAGGGPGRAPGEPCVYQNECEPFSGCFDDGMGAGICLHYCDFATYGTAGDFGQPANDPDNCEPGEICGGVVGETIVGVCVEDAW
jgi:hypothetical protein